MKNKQSTVTIINTCHSSWENMSTIEGGRFCTSCSKKVLDFTNMHVDEIIRIVQHAQVPVCGRINEDRVTSQLFLKYNKPGINFFKRIVAAFLLFLTTKTVFAKKPSVPLSIQYATPSKNIEGNLSKIDTAFTLKGRVIDQLTLQAIGDVEIRYNGNKSLRTNNKGVFKKILASQEINQTITLSFYKPGYIMRSLSFEAKDVKEFVNIKLEPSKGCKMGEIAIEPYTNLKK